MIEQVVNSIIEAEDAAKKVVNEAESQATQIITASELKASKITKDAHQSNKDYFSDRMTNIDGETTSKVSTYIEKEQKVVDKEMLTYSDNVDKAVKYILENIK